MVVKEKKNTHFFVDMYMLSLALRNYITHMFLMLNVMKLQLEACCRFRKCKTWESSLIIWFMLVEYEIIEEGNPQDEEYFAD